MARNGSSDLSSGGGILLTIESNTVSIPIPLLALVQTISTSSHPINSIN